MLQFKNQIHSAFENKIFNHLPDYSAFNFIPKKSAVAEKFLLLYFTANCNSYHSIR